MSVIDEIKNKAKANKKTVVLPETTDMRTLTAAAEVISEEIADIICQTSFVGGSYFLSIYWKRI